MVAVILNDAPEDAVILNEVAMEVAVILNDVAEAEAMEEEEAVGTVEAVEAVEEEKEEEALEEEEGVGAVETVAVGPRVKILQECFLVGIRQGEQECKWQSQRLGTPRLVMAVP